LAAAQIAAGGNIYLPESVTLAETYYNLANDGEDGMIPPVYLDEDESGNYLWEIVEKNSSSTILTGADKYFTSGSPDYDGRTAFIDGYTEFQGTGGDYLYSFDAYTGTVYLGSTPPTDRTCTFICKQLASTLVPEGGWRYFAHPIYKKLDTSKIVLNPSYVKTIFQQVSVSAVADKSVVLLGTQDKGHDWFKKKLVKGTVSIGSKILDGKKLSEVKFVDGQSELNSIISIQEEPITFSGPSAYLYTFALGKIDATHTLVSNGVPRFSSVRSATNPSTPVSQFNNSPVPDGTTLSANGEWSYSVGVDGVCTVSVYNDTGTMNDHSVSYTYQSTNPGIDADGLYSIDYDNGVIHFATNPSGTDTISFEISLYSIFYNIVEVVPDGDIVKVDGKARTIEFGEAFLAKMMRLDTVGKGRPAMLKVLYDYYKKTTENMKDLEPYFSPICKDVAFRAVTTSVLEEL
jgi:hypothetical protein